MSKPKGDFVDFKTIKQRITILQVLDHYGITQSLKRSGDSLSGCCPLHGGHDSSQFRVSLTKNCFKCFGQCNAGGNILDFVAKKENVNVREAALLIQKWFPVGGEAKPPIQAAPAPAKEATPAPPPQAATESHDNSEDHTTPNKALGFELKNIDAAHASLQERKFSKETIETFGLGFCSKGLMAGRIVIPIHNVGGELVAYAGLIPGEPPAGTPKYKLPNGFRRGVDVFNLHRACKEDRSAPLVLVREFLDCIHIWQSGYRRVAAFMGESLSDKQIELIVQAVGKLGHVMLLLEDDVAGATKHQTAFKRLASGGYVHALRLPAGKSQPDQLTPAEILALLQ